MKPCFRRGVANMLAALVLGIAISSSAAASQMRLVTLGTATLYGNYYALARTICRLVNVNDLNVRCSHEPTSGSLYNLFAMQRGELDFAIVQSDWQRMAFEGQGPFADAHSLAEMRSVMSLYPEAITLFARREASIESIADLKNRILDIGHPSTGRRGTNDRILEALGWEERDFRALRELSGPGVVEEICAGRIDASLIVFGHPNPLVAKVLKDCDVEIIPLSHPRLDAMVTDNPDYVPATIPAGTYSKVETPVETFSVAATLIVRGDISSDIVELFTHKILENHDVIRSAIPVLPELNVNNAKRDGLIAPLHDGAISAYNAFGR